MSIPFSSRIIEAANKLLDKITDEKKIRLEEVIKTINMTHNSDKTWKTIRKLSHDPATTQPPYIVSTNQVVYQLLINDKGTMPTKSQRLVISTVTVTSMVYPLSEEEYRRGVALLKNNKAAGRGRCSGGSTE